MRVDKSLIIWSIIGTGISSITVQLVTIREFLTQFHGNEITISLVLFVWLLLNGAGSLFSRPFKLSKASTYSLLILFVALWPLPQLVIIRYFRDMFMVHGTSPGFYQIFFFIIITTAPYALLIGYVLPGALDLLRAHHYDFTSGELYITDNIGDILGGAIFSFILVYWLNPFKTIAVTSSVLILTSLQLFIKDKNIYLAVLAIIAVSVFYFFALYSGFEKSTLTGQYGNILQYRETPIGRLIITKEEGQHSFWESGTPLYSDGDIISSEEKVHYPMCQLDNPPGDVLLISGGIGETLPELYKYNPKNIDYVELDPALTDMAIDAGLLKKMPGLNIINIDGRAFLKKTKKKYDVIIIDLPDPDTFQLNRFFTAEFFKLTKKRLNKNGILSFNVKSYENYISDIVRMKLSSIYNTVNQYYTDIIVIPGNDAYFICSDHKLYQDIPARLEKKSIKTEYIQYYFNGNVTSERISQLRNSIDPDEYVNTDFEPRLLNISFREWFSKHGSTPGTFFLAVVCFVIIYVILMRKEEYILFSSGMASMAVEMLVIYCFQIVYGYVYLKIGMLITAFLFGLLPGAAVGSAFRRKKYSDLLLSEIFIIGLLICFFVWVSFIRSDLHQIWFVVYCILFSFFCGFQFPVVTGIIGEKSSPAAGCLAADLAGAAAGTLIAGTLMVPLAGIQATVLIIIFIKITSCMIILFGSKT
jgi:spermidine synthase